MICSDKAWALIQKSMKACYNLADGTGSLGDLDDGLVELAEYIKKLESPKFHEGCTCYNPEEV